MKKVKNRNFSAVITVLLAVIFSVNVFAQATGDPIKGKDIFKQNCAACHKLEAKFVGPPLGDIEKRRTSEWLHKWIKNSAELIKSGDKDAVAVFEEYNKVPMLAYETILSDQDITDVIAYTSNPSAAEEKVAQAPVNEEVAQGDNAQTGEEIQAEQQVEGKSYLTEILLVLSFIVLAILAFVMVKAHREIKKLAKKNDKETYLKQSKYFPLWNIFVKNRIIIGTLMAGIFFSATYFAFGYLMQVGIDQGYQPIQEIHYSHKIHAGDNQIDCKFCHSAARTSKTAGIPSLNVCMNCHKTIDEYTGPVEPEKGLTKEFYDGEIQKLYDAVGWDTDNMKYTGVEKPVKWTRILQSLSTRYCCWRSLSNLSR